MEDARQSGALPSLSEASDVHAPRALHSTPREAGARQLTFLAPASLMHKLVFSSAPASHVHMPALAPHLPTLCTLEAASAAHPRCYPTCAQHAPMSPAEGLDPGRRWSAPRSAAAHRCQLLPRLSSCTTKSCSPQVYFFVCFFRTFTLRRKAQQRHNVHDKEVSDNDGRAQQQRTAVSSCQRPPAARRSRAHLKYVILREIFFQIDVAAEGSATTHWACQANFRQRCLVLSMLASCAGNLDLDFSTHRHIKIFMMKQRPSCYVCVWPAARRDSRRDGGPPANLSNGASSRVVWRKAQHQHVRCQCMRPSCPPILGGFPFRWLEPRARSEIINTRSIWKQHLYITPMSVRQASNFQPPLQAI